MSTNEIIRRRALRSSGAAIDWESIARGMLDYTRSFELPESVDVNTFAANQLFYRQHMSGHATIKDGTTTPPTLGSNALNGTTALASIYVPDASVEAYKAASGWSTYASKIKPISERPVGRVILNQFNGWLAAAERVAA